jgi:hypothetical protein
MAVSHSSSTTSFLEFHLSSVDDWWGTLEHDIPKRSSIIKEYRELAESAVAAASDEQEFKDELDVIMQWFRVLSPPERAHLLCRLLAIHSTPRKSQLFALVILKTRGLQPHGETITVPNHPAVVLVEVSSAIDECEFFEDEVSILEQWFKVLSGAEQLFVILTLLDAIDDVFINIILDLLVEVSAGTDHSNGIAAESKHGR